MSKNTTHSWTVWLLVSVVFILVIAGAVLLLRTLPAGTSYSNSQNNQSGSSSKTNSGVKLEITFKGGSANGYYPQASFYLKDSESLHPTVPPGEFTAVMKVPVSPGKLRTAKVGATFSGCAVTVLRDEKILVHRTEAGDEVVTIFSDDMAIASRNAVITYVIEVSGDSGGETVFRALWQPVNAKASFQLPVANDNWLSGDQLSEGLALIQKLNCVNCHESSDTTLNSLLRGGACPDLTIAASKLNHDWVVKWIVNPAKIKTNSTMPAVLKEGTTTETVEDIIHYLKSLGKDTATNITIEVDDALIQKGMKLYHEVGCVACHGPMDKELKNIDSYLRLSDLSQKYSVNYLTEFLFDPVNWRPDGRMPSLKLTKSEASAIAAYLLPDGNINTVEGRQNDSAKAERGKNAFIQNQCYRCHETGIKLTDTEDAITPFESLVGNIDGGCLSEDNTTQSVKYKLSNEKRQSVKEFIKVAVDSNVSNVHMLSLAANVKRFNCTACHSWGGETGPEEMIEDYFKVTGIKNATLEDRLPPSLDNAGARLKDNWLHEVMEEGKSVRNYLLTRMPQYGKNNVDKIPDQLISAAGIKQDDISEINSEPIDSDKLRIGQSLVGEEGLNCISCHDLAGKPATITPGLDLATNGERLRPDYFKQWMFIPHELRPDTRMPSFFIGESSPIAEHYDGDSEKQIEAIYAYLSHSDEEIPLEVTESKPGYELSVTDEPIVFRTFINDGKNRVTVCGYPEQINCAFDMTHSRLLYFWEGEFIDKDGKWKNQNSGRTIWQSPDGPTFFKPSRLNENWQVTALGDIQFRGMKLDSDRKPIFLYNLKLSDSAISIEEQPIPESLGRRFVLSGPPNEVIYFNGGEYRLVSASIEVNKKNENNLIQLVLDSSGKAEFEVEASR